MGSITKQAVSGPRNTHSHHRAGPSPHAGTNTCQVVSSACRCQESRDRAQIASSSGASSAPAAAAVPVSVAGETSAPCRASPVTSEFWLPPATYRSVSSIAMNPARTVTKHNKHPCNPQSRITADVSPHRQHAPSPSHTISDYLRVDGRQRERSFATAREAQDFKIKTDHDMRAQIFVDDKLGREDFGAAVDAWIDRHAVTDSTKGGYRVTARAWVKVTFEGRTIAQVANDGDWVADLLAKDMGHLSITRQRQARTIITGTLDEAVKAGKLTSTICRISRSRTRAAPKSAAISCSRRISRSGRLRKLPESRCG